MKEISKVSNLANLLLLIFSFNIISTIFPTSNIYYTLNRITISSSCSTTNTLSSSSTINFNSNSFAALLVQFKLALKLNHFISILFIKRISYLSFMLIERIYRPPRACFVINSK
ncbi:hypothetical protein CDV26_08150 [Francisella halioticida]|uniref:Uncharacterized protein n=1 Tax=Francisella halioticida TaxID=549298 RepID=A0ABN5AZG8_9GAMM|nr:hypothetical protein CDV26_08150 [Francisella halioticida]